MSLFRLVHASDLHFSRVAHKIGIPDLLQAWVTNTPGTWAPVSSQGDIYVDAFAAWVDANKALFDALLISGDLATTGDPADLRAAHRFVFSPVHKGYLSARGQPTLQTTNKPICLLPGNHDRFGHAHFPGDTAFDRVFQIAWTVKQGAEVLYSQPHGAVQIILIGADFSLRPSDWGQPILGLPFGFLGQGRVNPKILNRLVALTHRERQCYAERVVLWVIHFEPDAAPSLALLAENLLQHELQNLHKAGVEIDGILCGHTHQANIAKRFGNTAVYVSGTVTQHASATGNEFLVLDINKGARARATITPVIHKYDVQHGDFRP